MPLTCPAWDAAEKESGKADKKRNLFERSEFVSFPALPFTFSGTRRAAALRRLLLVTFLGEARKVTSRRATPGKHPRSSIGVMQRKTPKRLT